MPDEAPWSNVKATLYAFFNRNPKSNRSVAQIVVLTPDAHTLDIGCGPGAAVRAVAGEVRQSVGVDPSPRMVELARARSGDYRNVEFAVGAVEALPFPDDSFTHAWAIKSWHHWNDSPRGLSEVARVLASGGRLTIIERETNGAHGLSRSAAEQLEQEMIANGFVDTSTRVRAKDLVVSGASR